MNKILILGMYRFPDGDAPSNRLLALAKSLKNAGFSPFVVANGSILSRNGCATGCRDGIEYTSIRGEKDSRFVSAIRRVFATFFLAQSARKMVPKDDVFCVITTLGTLSFSLIILCKIFWRKPLIVDCMEWHESSQFKYGVLSPQFLLFTYRFKFLTRLVRNFIGISEFLTQHLSSSARHVIRIPPQVDVDAFLPHGKIDSLSIVRLLYAGSSTGKDDLISVLRALAKLSEEERSRVLLSIAGPGIEEISRVLKSLELDRDIHDCIRALGRIPRDEVLSELSRAHFTVLIRPDALYSRAGFPSKIPESLAAGVPVITNLTSDLSGYLTDGRDCIVVAGCTSDAILDSIRRVLSLDLETLGVMSHEARRCAMLNFDYRGIRQEIGAFVRAAE